MTDRTVSVRLRLMTTEWTAAAQRAGASIRDLDQQIENARKDHQEGMDDLAQAGMAMGGAIALGFGYAVKSAMDFEKAMSGTKAATSASAAEMDALRESALQAGRDTAYSAIEAANAQTELAKAGLKTADILGGGLKGALDLASAGGLEVADAAEIAASAMTQFGLKGSAIPHVADLLAAGANKAQGSVQDMGLALSQSGLVANQFGISIEETVGTLTAFASAGLLSSDAGTSFKTMLLRLAAPSKEASSLMEDLGIKAYDAQGNFVGLEKFAGQLRTGMRDLTAEQRQQSLATIFGSDAIRAASILYNEGAEGISEWKDAVNESGYAAQLSATKMDNLAGDLEKLKGEIQSALIDQGSGATTVLRTLTQTGENMIGVFNALPGPLQAVITTTVLLGGTVMFAAGAYVFLAPKVLEANAALLATGPAGQMASNAIGTTARFAGRALLTFTAFQLATTAIGNSMDRSAADVKAFTSSLEDFGRTGKASGAAADQFGKSLGILKYDLESLDDSLLNKIDYGTAKIIETLTGTGELFEESATNAKRRIKELDQALADMVRSGNGEAAAAAFERLVDIAGKEGVSRRELENGLKEYGHALKEAAEAADLAGQAEARQTAQADLLTRSLADTVAAGKSLIDVFKELNGASITLTEAQIQAEETADRLTAALQENGATLDINTEAGRTNLQTILDLIQAAGDAADAKFEESNSVAAASDTYNQYINQLRTVLQEAGFTDEEINRLIDSYGRMPQSVQTAITVDTEQAYRELGHLEDYLNQLRRVPTPQATEVDGGVVEFYASGGLRDQHTAQVMPAGTMRVWAEGETGGEAYIPLAPHKRARSRQVAEATMERLGGSVSWGRTVPMMASPADAGPDLRPYLARIEQAVYATVTRVVLGDKDVARSARRGEQQLAGRAGVR